MAKTESPLQQAEKQVKELLVRVNTNIEYLGLVSGKMYNALIDIQHSFDLIRCVPAEEALKFEEVKKLSSSWKLQAERIEKEYDDFIAKNAMAGAAGGALGVGVAAFGPTVAMGVATTFGVASTGTAISALGGAAATNAALAWLGGGALAAGGGGMAAGQALLTLAGPIGWTIGIASLATCGIIFFLGRKRQKRLEEIFTLVTKREFYTYKLAETEIKEKVNTIINETSQLVAATQEIKTFGTDYRSMTEEQQYRLGVYVNLMFAATQNLIKPINALIPKFSIDDLKAYSLVNSQLSSINYKFWKLIISLANFFHAIELNESDINILYKSLKKNEQFMKSTNIKKDEFKKIFINFATNIDLYKYPCIRIN